MRICTIILLVLLPCMWSHAETKWTDGEKLTIEGRGWAEITGYNRLPDRAKGHIPESVWGLSRQSAGLSVRFRTNSATIEVKWSVSKADLAMPHMPATGVSGIDIYGRDADGTWRFKKNGRPTGVDNTVSVAVGNGPMREYAIWLPTYNGTRSVAIGTDDNATITPSPRQTDQSRPVVIYGTSITQGACASRPGTAYTAILERRLNRPVINLGFSGSGKMEQEVVDLVAEIDTDLYVIDCLWNMGGMKAELIQARVDALVRTIRVKHPATPIVLIGQTHFAGPHPTSSSKAQATAVDQLAAAGIPNLHLVDAAGLIGTDGEGTVDGCHPNDLGMMRMADALTPLLQKLVP